MEKEDSASLAKDGKVTGRVRDQVPIVFGFLKEPRILDVPIQASGDRLQFPGVQAPWRLVAEGFQNGFNLSKKASLVNSSTHTMSWWNDL